MDRCRVHVLLLLLLQGLQTSAEGSGTLSTFLHASLFCRGEHSQLNSNVQFKLQTIRIIISEMINLLYVDAMSL